MNGGNGAPFAICCCCLCCCFSSSLLRAAAAALPAAVIARSHCVDFSVEAWLFLATIGQTCPFLGAPQRPHLYEPRFFGRTSGFFGLRGPFFMGTADTPPGLVTIAAASTTPPPAAAAAAAEVAEAAKAAAASVVAGGGDDDDDDADDDGDENGGDDAACTAGVTAPRAPASLGMRRVPAPAPAPLPAPPSPP